MKKSNSFFNIAVRVTIKFLTILLFINSCSSPEPGSDIISLDREWKFRTGDNHAWAEPDFNDGSWESISNRRIWEKQGYDEYDGYAWYRTEIFLPSKLKKNSFFKDSLQFILGTIDDTDQTFLNGRILGVNNETIQDPESGYPQKFEGNPEAYSYFRKYKIAADDPRILWDQTNVIAIRVHDHGGGGGINYPTPSVSMIDLKDFLSFNVHSSAFKISENHYSKEIIINNTLKNQDLSGELKIKVKNPETEEVFFESVENISISKESQFAHIFNFDAPQENSYHIEYFFLASGAKNPVYASQHAPYILTPPSPLTPSINAASVYGAGRGKPFMYKVPVSGERPIKYQANGLPAGLNIDENTGIITGSVNKEGEYEVELIAFNNKGSDVKTIRFSIGDKLALTPPLGWNSWNVWGLSVNDSRIREAAKAMKESGLIDYGWTYINIDDGWEAPERTQWGELLSNEKFPDMKALADYVHDLGLKIGIYSSPGPLTCGGYPGSYEHELQDARTWAGWGIDFLKHDWCSYREIAKDNSIEELKKPYLVMRNALNRVNRDIIYSLCQYGMGDVWKWGKEVGGNLWRTTGDITDTWESMSTIGFNEYRSSDYAETGHWNDVDMMVVGWVGWGPDLHLTRLTPDEQYTHISLWTLLASPMLLGCDLTKLDDFTLNLLTNLEVLAIHQDEKGDQADKLFENNDIQVWVKELSDGSLGIGFFNIGDERIKTELAFSEIGLEGNFRIRDLWRQTDLEMNEGILALNLPSHGVLLTKFTPQN